MDAHSHVQAAPSNFHRYDSSVDAVLRPAHRLPESSCVSARTSPVEKGDVPAAENVPLQAWGEHAGQGRREGLNVRRLRRGCA
jgi:hypothetical protein